MTARKYNDEQLEQAFEMRERGLTYGQIAIKTGIHRASVAHHCLIKAVDAPQTADKPDCYFGPPEYVRNGRKVRLFTPDEDRKITAWALEGISRSEIARRLGRAQNSVTYRLFTLARREQRAEKASA